MSPSAKNTLEYPLLNPLLAAGTVFDFAELAPFNGKVARLIEERHAAGKVEHVSVYLRDLENGPMRGVNYDEKFTPASLLKVPMLLAALKHAESNPEFLSKKVRFDIPTRSVSYLSSRALFPGVEYTIEEVIRAMAVHSDNDALSILAREIPADEQNQVFRDFGLVIPQERSLEDSMTIREYAGFFRVLYNASYLNKEMSQKALSFLEKSEFRMGISAGVPAGVPVAHKYGERFFSGTQLKQLHDCGIVYHPARHYILCVMTRGADFENLAGVIRDVSRMVFDEITSSARH